ncbi:flavohemoglobin expression-modulating QEGLA motif protein [Vibrio maerlii]|uniref:flavohemoglobin expression-modulating QEGLA motif protein n=1 Tax=Vibrio maerlii TaxID=2231648 RepID=UPI000E3D0ECA|nr:flavohemoglobin expression-modulating QEGLA motif protein [Vibrio maerlii]
MLQLTEHEIYQRINERQPFEAVLNDGSLRISISEYQPYVATVLHSGHRLRGEIAPACLLSDEQRFKLEAPYTEELVSSLPVILEQLDSLCEYDLTLPEQSTTKLHYEASDVWEESALASIQAIAVEKHQTYYRIFNHLLTELNKLHGFSVVYDITAVSGLDAEDQPNDRSEFELVTNWVNKRKWSKEVDNMLSRLQAVELPNIEVTAISGVTQEHSNYQALFVKQHLPNTLMLPIRIKKVFMNEVKGDRFPLVMEKLKEEMKSVISGHAAQTILRKSSRRKVSRGDILASRLPKEVLKLDRQLFAMAKSINTLNYITPANLKHEKRAFLRRPFDYQPNFTYRQLDLDPYKFREQLYRLPIDDVRDADIQKMYRRVIDQLAVRIDLLAGIGTEEFRYNSLRYYGRPEAQDIANANFILHAKNIEIPNERNYTAKEAIDAFKQAAADYGVNCKVIGTNKIIARALVSGQTLKVNLAACFTQQELDALIHHELGVHVLTSANANEQTLKVLKLGLPGNTHSQEGLAILSEYLAGCFSVERFKTLALRVLAVENMVKGERFSDTYNLLRHDYGLGEENAFTITSRVYRGGGFTKDFLYLKGLKDAVQAHKEGDLTSMFVGKTSFEFKPLLDELITREIIQKPKFVPIAYENPAEQNAIMEYLIDCIH